MDQSDTGHHSHQPLIDQLNPSLFPRLPVDTGRAFDFDEAEKNLSDNPPVRDRLNLLRPTHAGDLIAGVCAGSSYLSGILRRRPDLIVTHLDASLEAQMAQILQSLREAEAASAPTAAGLADLARTARRKKEEAALLLALGDLGGALSLEQVMDGLSELADCTLQIGVRLLFRIAVAKGLWLSDETDPQRTSGYFVLAMGKHGGRELNYSSDIDLIVLYERERCRAKSLSEAQAFYVRLTQDLVKFMSQRTPEGYIFRTDLRLRPDPGATQVALSTDAAAHYYESFGQNWERAALIKARPVAGDMDTGRAFLDDLSPFIWRKYLDFAAIADIHAMKRQIHAHRGFAKIAVAGHDIKVGRGGIREIEFFAQTQQLIAGGRQPDLRTPRTLEALKLLAQREWISDPSRSELSQAYRYLRAIEHRIQMVADEQTQKLPSDDDQLSSFARFCGYETRDQFCEAVKTQLGVVQGHYAELFEDVPSLTSGQSNLVFTGEDNDPETAASLQAMGFADPRRVQNIVRAWHRGRYRATATRVARERLTELTPVILHALSETVDPDAALLGFDRMLAELPAGIQLFALLHANPGLLQLIADITGSAPRLAQILARRRRVIDAVLDTQIMSESLPEAADLDSLVHQDLRAAETFEDALDRARVIGAEQSFLIGVRVLARLIGADQAGHGYAQLAESLIRELHRIVDTDFQIKHGTVPGGACAVLAMGKLGGMEMTAASDLDLIVIYSAADGAKASSGGERDLSVQQYFARFTQRLITALSAPTAQGPLFEVDLRLRPSGQKGPVATNLQSFATYQHDQAWTWEHMALTRARVISGPADLTERINAIIHDALTRKRDPQGLTAAVRDMRQRIAAEKGTNDIWDLKQVRGGLVDLEFVAQYLQLKHAHDYPEILSPTTREAFVRLDSKKLLGDAGERLIGACDLLHELTQILRLCFDGVFIPAKAPDGLKQLLAETANLPDFERLEAHLRTVQADVHGLFDELIPNTNMTEPTRLP